MKERIYLDNNASTPLDPRVKDFIADVLPLLGGNPSSTHSFGQHIRGLISKARSAVANYFHVKTSELIFTSSGTECANMVLRGVSKGHVVTSDVEHSCVYTTAEQMQSEGWDVTFLSSGLMGAVTPQAVEAVLRPDTKLIALMAVNNETGVKTNIEAIAEIAQKRNIPFFVDGVALLGKEPFSISPGVSAMSFSGHKIHALQGTGLTFVRAGFKLQPLLVGGEHEFGRRAGTENVLGILAFAKAVELLVNELPESSRQMTALRDRFETTIKSKLADVHVNGKGLRVGNTSNLAFAGADGETLLMHLDRAGIAASHGSACSSGAMEPSRVLLNMGIARDLVLSSIRFSLSRMTTEQEIDRATEVIIDAVKRLR